jgi:hypothetical protein
LPACPALIERDSVLLLTVWNVLHSRTTAHVSDLKSISIFYISGLKSGI